MDMALSAPRDQIVRRVLRDLRDHFGGKIVGRKLVPLADAAGDFVEHPVEPAIETGNAKWYVLLCHPQEERSAAAHLIGRRFKVYLPLMPRVATRGVRRAKIIVHEPMFRGYLFIRLDMALDARRLHFVNATPGINRFMQIEDDYAIVPDVEMLRVQNVEQGEEKAHLRRAFPTEYSIGEKVRIAEGSFSGINAQIVRLDDEARITVLLSLLGRAVKVTLPTVGLEKL